MSDAAKTAEEPAYQHVWGRYNDAVKGERSSWSRCKHCRVIKLYEWTPGWPGWTKYFDPEGRKELAALPPCVKPVQPSPYS